MKIAAVVILYHPQEAVLTNIKTYYDYVDKIFVFDNSEKESVLKERLKKLAKIEVYQDFANAGIAKPLNNACELAIEEKYEWILTMDQDSTFSADAIDIYFSCFEQFKNKEKVAMFGTNHNRDTRPTSAKCEVKEPVDLITSGALLNLSLFEEIGAFDEGLFIDSVDRDYCVRSKMKGYAIIQFANIYFVHELGKEVYKASIKTLFLYKKRKEIHSPLRCYYMYRNMLYLEKKYALSNKPFAKRVKKEVVAHMKTCILYGGDIKEYFKYLKLAKTDFLNNNMGKLNKEL